jgi:hypothetical protein
MLNTSSHFIPKRVFHDFVEMNRMENSLYIRFFYFEEVVPGMIPSLRDFWVVRSAERRSRDRVPQGRKKLSARMYISNLA